MAEHVAKEAAHDDDNHATMQQPTAERDEEQQHHDHEEEDEDEFDEEEEAADSFPAEQLPPPSRPAAMAQVHVTLTGCILPMALMLLLCECQPVQAPDFKYPSEYRPCRDALARDSQPIHDV